MQLNAADVESILIGIMTYEPQDVTVHSIEEKLPGKYLVEFELNEAPRDETEFLVDSNPDYNVSYDTTFSESDNAPCDNIVRFGRNMPREDLEEIEALEGQDLPDEMTIIIAGDLSTPEYSDDETDGYLNAMMWIELGTRTWAEEESIRHVRERAEASLSAIIKTVTQRVASLREMGHTATIAVQEVKGIVRACLSPVPTLP